MKRKFFINQVKVKRDDGDSLKIILEGASYDRRRMVNWRNPITLELEAYPYLIRKINEAYRDVIKLETQRLETELTNLRASTE